MPSVVVLWPGGRDAVGLALALLLDELVLVVPEDVVVVADDEEEELVVDKEVVDGTPGEVVGEDPSHIPYAAWHPEISEQYVSDEPQNPHWEQHCPKAQPMQLLLLPQVPSVVVLWPGGRTTVGLAVLLLLLLLLVVVVELVVTVVDEVVVVTVDVDELLVVVDVVVVADVVVVIEPSQTP